ncbi:MAG: hypothetical protein JST00_45635 [Deltaproteobacteria bacterium]|nr:hypothetical protein [Deltaproteobacteria bacterium]
MSYRDERETLQHRVARLEEELQDARKEADRLSAELKLARSPARPNASVRPHGLLSFGIFITLTGAITGMILGFLLHGRPKARVYTPIVVTSAAAPKAAAAPRAAPAFVTSAER